MTGVPLHYSHRLEVRAQVAQAFLTKFQLSGQEMAALRGARDTPITEVRGGYRSDAHPTPLKTRTQGFIV